ncbi:hypothetical protein [Halobaculum sp. EA56]|uniref:hypothetical protein n=1 Tax=Halobaculum sp. EA56 TaxID=3421648 RepID=UPI003EBB7557
MADDTERTDALGRGAEATNGDAAADGGSLAGGTGETGPRAGVPRTRAAEDAAAGETGAV